MRHTKKCLRCARRFPTGRRSGHVFCPQCCKATKGLEFFALIRADRSGIYKLCSSMEQATEAMREDAAIEGGSGLILRKVIGHQGALNELHWTDPDADIYRKREEAQDRADFEAIQ